MLQELHGAVDQVLLSCVFSPKWGVCVCWKRDVCFLSTGVANVIARNCVLHMLSRVVLFFVFVFFLNEY